MSCDNSITLRQLLVTQDSLLPLQHLAAEERVCHPCGNNLVCELGKSEQKESSRFKNDGNSKKLDENSAQGVQNRSQL